jgi:hypothetical protein
MSKIESTLTLEGCTVEIPGVPISTGTLTATYDGTHYRLSAATAHGPVTIALDEDGAQRLGAWLQHGAGDEVRRKRLDAQFHPPGEGQ